MKKDYKPILCLDFDGVIHSYTSGWKGPRVIPDNPVPGAMEFISLQALYGDFQIAIYSSRSRYWFGRRAMQKWLELHMSFYFHAKAGFVSPTPDFVPEKTNKVIRAISWPLFKPSALVTIDDRAIRFDGTWPTDAELKEKPWYLKENKP